MSFQSYTPSMPTFRRLPNNISPKIAQVSCINARLRFQQEDFLSKKSGTFKTYFPIVLVAPAAATGREVPSEKEVAQLLFDFCPCSKQQEERKLGPVRSRFVVVRWSTFLTSSHRMLRESLDCRAAALDLELGQKVNSQEQMCGHVQPFEFPSEMHAIFRTTNTKL